MIKKKRKEEPQHSESKILKWVLILSSVAVGLTIDHIFPGWGRPVLVTLLIFGSLVVFCQRYWSLPFWTVAIGAFTLHAALMFHFQAEINRLPVAELFFCGVIEIIVIAAILGFVFPDHEESPLRR